MNKSFNELNLNSNIVEGLKLQGITSPTEVQELTIPKALENIDIIAESHTGSGKTLAYLCPIFYHGNVDSFASRKNNFLAGTIDHTGHKVIYIYDIINRWVECYGINHSFTSTIFLYFLRAGLYSSVVKMVAWSKSANFTLESWSNLLASARI